MQAEIILLVLSFVGVLYYLMPLLPERDKSSPSTTSDSDDGRLIGACFDDSEKGERLIEDKVKATLNKHHIFKIQITKYA